MSYRFADSLLLANLYVLPYVQWKTPDDGTEELSETIRVLLQK